MNMTLILSFQGGKADIIYPRLLEIVRLSEINET